MPFYLYPNIQCVWAVIFLVKQRKYERMGQERRVSSTLKTLKCPKPTNNETNSKKNKKENKKKKNLTPDYSKNLYCMCM